MRNPFVFHFLILTSFIFLACAPHPSPTPEQKLQHYQSKARTYKALSDLQRLSPPYAFPTNGRAGLGLDDEGRRMIYLNQARRYDQMAKEVGNEIHSDANDSTGNGP